VITPAGRIVLCVALCVAAFACTSAPGSPDPTVTAASSASPSAATPYDGIWASDPLTRDDLAAALDARSLSTVYLDSWWPDFDELDYRIFEIEIGEGRWTVYENAEGIGFGAPWAGPLEMRDENTIAAQDDEHPCPVTFDLELTGTTLAVRVADDACDDPFDLAVQVATYEASAFRLVQAPNWVVPEGPAPASSLPLVTSTSRDRSTPRPAGTVDGAPLGYLEYLPPRYSETGDASPLLIFLHGSGESGVGDTRGLGLLSRQGIPLLIADNLWPDERPFIVLSPQHAQVDPSFCMEAREIDAFLHFAIEHYNVDQTRVYATGVSCGAIGLWNYVGAHEDEVLAAAVPIAGHGIAAVERAGCDLGRLPIWAFHGARDDDVVVRGDVFPIETLQRCTDPAAVDARLTVYPALRHDAWTTTYSGASGYDVFDWMLSHRK
jgi:dienelactone hydrolase